MKFYDALQLDPAILKRKIAACDTKQEKARYWVAMAVRSALIVAFAIVFISLLSGVFGTDNTPLAVALFCMMLGIRFVNFTYCIGDSLVTLAAVLAILVLAPGAAVLLPPVLLIPLHFAAFFALLYMTSQQPEMGNGGLYSFAYIYLTGNPVLGEALVRRGLLALVGYLICGAILVAKHRDQHKTTRFVHVVRRFDLSTPVHLWQLRMALGVSLVLTAGQVFGVERFMWMVLPARRCCRSIPIPAIRPSVFGSGSWGRWRAPWHFWRCIWSCPPACVPCWGRWTGCAWDSAPTRYKTAMNCFGALSLGAGLYGLTGAVLLRITDTLLGVLFGLVFAAVFHRLAAVRLLACAREE